jgi:hypothetical protein
VSSERMLCQALQTRVARKRCAGSSGGTRRRIPWTSLTGNVGAWAKPRGGRTAATRNASGYPIVFLGQLINYDSIPL